MENSELAEHSTSQNPINPSFSGHQTFPFRYTWLKKGVDAVKEKANVFTDDEAPVILGVGKNMVQSIRHWCLAANLIEKIEKTSDNSSGFETTKFSKKIFYENGYDPYLENPSTLWWIHWNIATNNDHAVTWCWAFNFLNYPEFSRDSLLQDLRDWIKQQENIKKQPSENTIKQDVSCFIRTYCLSRSTVSKVIEDTFDCPLVELDLIREVPNENGYQFNLGTKPSLTEPMLAFAITDFWNRGFSNIKNTLSFSEIMYSKFSPGQVFKLDENTVVMCLEKLEAITDGVMTYDDSAGLKQIYRHKNLDSFKLLKKVYEQNTIGSLSR
ncbi:MAG: DUF4007 family protein [Candidatus Poribacteria bacterium]|nr:DUF4007 family protein [Candidatus Poribacteria bacterium]